MVRQALEKSGSGSHQQEGYWHSNVNLVTGVSESWLDEAFSLDGTEQSCVLAGVGGLMSAYEL